MKKFKKFLKGLLIVILVLAVIHGIASMVLSRRVASKLAEIKAQGDPVSMADLGKIDIPDSENGATIYMQIFKEMGRPIEYYATGIPHLGELDRTKNYDYSKLETQKEITPEMWSKAKISLGTHKHALYLVDEAISRPRCKFKSNWKDGAGAFFPYYGNMRELARMLRSDARISARDGNMDLAVKRVGQIFKVSGAVKEDTILISYFVRLAMISVGLMTMRDIEQDGKISAAQAKYLDNILSQFDLDKDYIVDMKGERAFAINNYNIVQGKALPADKPWYGGIVICSALRPLFLLDEMIYLDFMAKKLRSVNLPYIESTASKPGYNEVNEVPKYAIYARTTIPVYAKTEQVRDIGKSRIRSGRAYLGLIAYKEKFDAYPQSLDELRSKLGWKVEVDPLTGKDFHYERQGAGFLLYGVGPNLRDDGGVYRRKKATDPPSEEYDDIVWQLAR
ncbi:MAG: hypothetical protein ACYC0V_06635 [Armatimonadota bacterium]